MGKFSKKQRDQRRYAVELERARKTTAKTPAAATSPASGLETDQTDQAATGEPGPSASASHDKRVDSSFASQGPEGLKEPEWQEGERPRTFICPGRGLEGAYQFLQDLRGQCPLSIESLVTSILLTRPRPRIECPLELQTWGAILTIACSVTSKEPGGNGVAQKMLRDEANALLSEKALPLPLGVDRDQLFIPTTEFGQAGKAGWHEVPVSETGKDRLEEAEIVTKKLRDTNSELKSTLIALRAEVKDAYEARDDKELEVASLKESVEKAKRASQLQVARPGKDDARTPTSVTKPPPPERSEQTDFVIRALGESVKDLIQQLKEKNERLTAFVAELAGPEPA